MGLPSWLIRYNDGTVYCLKCKEHYNPALPKLNKKSKDWDEDTWLIWCMNHEEIWIQHHKKT